MSRIFNKTGFFILIFILINQQIMAQTNYETNWKSVVKLESEGKTKDALQKVTSILEQSKKDKNNAQTVKALMYKYKYMMKLEEEAEYKIINELKTEIQQVDAVEKAVLHSILAELYYQYYQENTWRFADRTATDTLQSNDFRTWDLQTLIKEINTNYVASLADKDILQQTKLDGLTPILTKQEGSVVYRPTLYDLLAFRAIEYFNHDKSNLAEPSNAFSINQPIYFTTAASFIKLPLLPEDSSSQTYHALRIFQDVLAFRLNDKSNIDALADADLKRIQYIKEHYFNKDENETLYYDALKRLQLEYTNSKVAAMVNYEMAKYIYQQAKQQNTTSKFTLSDVLALIQKTQQTYPNSEGATNCEVLKTLVLKKEIQITTEETVVPNEPFKALVKYANIAKVYVKIVPIDYTKKDELFEIKNKETQATVIARLNALKPIKKWNVNLPGSDDYNEHSTEIKVDGIKHGFYAVMVATNPDFSITSGANAVAVSTLFASNISFTQQSNATIENVELYVLDRNSGQPLPNATVQFYINDYDYQKRKYICKDLGTAKADANGLVSKKIAANSYDYHSRNYQFDIKYKDDFLPSKQSYYKYYAPDVSTSKPDKQVHLFTDRSIYRPGQTIYFKGIVTQRNNETYNTLADNFVVVTFKDVNYQDIQVKDFRTNEFGSFTGTFTAPSTGLLGNMTLETGYGAVNVQVEEYKRPKFEVIFDDIKKSYNLNDTVQVSGKALSYSGATIDNAEVKYSVRRVAQFPIWCFWGWYRPWMPPSSEKIIAFGTSTTDADGAFTIDFAAIPDLSVSKEFKPYFNYEITADVVDINGETHSSTTTVRVGYIAIDATMTLDDKIDYTQDNNITITTNNLNGQPEPTDVTISIYELKEPTHPKKERLWSKPDKYVLSPKEHEQYFPYDAYNEKDEQSQWERGNEIKTYFINTGKQQVINLQEFTLRSGAYLISFSCQDKKGNKIEFNKPIVASSLQDEVLKPKAFAYFNVDKKSAKVGETLYYQIGTTLQQVYAIIDIAYKGKIVEKKYVQLSNQIKTFELPITKSWVGGVELSYSIVQKNRIYSDKVYVDVPYDNTDLSVEWISFRDKILPGSKEQWKLKISGPKKEKVSAELLATMYDASLDAFLPHSFHFLLPKSYYSGYLHAYSTDAFGSVGSSLYISKNWDVFKNLVHHGYDDLNLFGLSFGYTRYYKYALMKSTMMKSESVAFSAKETDAFDAAMAAPSPEAPPMEEGSAGAMFDKKASDTNANKPAKKDITPRTNLKETAFFFPQLQTDADGNIILNFDMPEALTKWNFLGLAHTKALNYQYFTKSVVTQKELMVTPNAPRFLREGDVLDFTSKISNLSDRDLSGVANIAIYDAATMHDITTQFMSINGGKATFFGKDFFVEKGKNTAVRWQLHVPQGVDAIVYKVVAQADNFSDGEQASCVVLPNRMLVTETMPLWINGKSKKSFTFKKLVENKSKTAKNYNLTLEMSSQPVWYAVQALPYMMEYPYECAEQLFSRYYANSLATFIANENPKIKSVFEKWKNTDALLSNLEKNQELKNVLLEETPWVRDAQNETEQKKRIALLFDLTKMANEQQKAFDKLEQMQSPNGGFMWFAGMPDNRYITQHIVAGLGHLAKLQVVDISNKSKLDKMLQNAVRYLDERLKEDFENIKKYDKDYLTKNHLYYNSIHALYARSFFNYKIEKQYQAAYDYFLNQEKKYALEQSLYSKALIALTLQRNNEKATADKIITALKQNAINSEEFGMYWKENEKAGWYWYQAPVETQAALIEAFHEVANDTKSVDAMKVWLLKQKQTTSWKSTKATAEACYALLLQGKDWSKSDKLVSVKMNKNNIDLQQLQAIVEPGTGYYKINWKGDDIKPEMGKIELSKSDNGPAFGAVYWQYFEDIDKISGANTALQLSKKLFKEVNTTSGKKLLSITENTPLKVGDVVKVRIELRTDRNLEYVHLKDMRASGFEPINVLSQYKYQDGLGYYESTKDVATHFFMDWMQKGIYVFEYAMRATIAGNFSNGITSIESMYAPEFKAHSKGERVIIVNK